MSDVSSLNPAMLSSLCHDVQSEKDSYEKSSSSSPIEIPKESSNPRIVYTKNFLMDLRFSPPSLVKPDKLPSLSIICEESNVNRRRESAPPVLTTNSNHNSNSNNHQQHNSNRYRTVSYSNGNEWKRISYNRKPRPRQLSESAIGEERWSRC